MSEGCFILHSPHYIWSFTRPTWPWNSNICILPRERQHTLFVSTKGWIVEPSVTSDNTDEHRTKYHRQIYRWYCSCCYCWCWYCCIRCFYCLLSKVPNTLTTSSNNTQKWLVEDYLLLDRFSWGRPWSVVSSVSCWNLRAIASFLVGSWTRDGLPMANEHQFSQVSEKQITS